MLNNAFMDKIRPTNYPCMIRIGSNNDGGYVIPELSDFPLSNLFSFGFGYNADFELEALSNIKVKFVYLYDYSITSMFSTLIIDLKHFLKNYFRSYSFGSIGNYFKFSRTFLIVKLHRNIHYRPYKLTKISGKENEIDIKYLGKEIGFSESIIKMDVEGSEFDVLNVENFKYIESAQIIIVEFHDCVRRELAFYHILNLFESKFYIVNTHINNFGKISQDGIPDVIELTFLNRKFAPANLKLVKKIPNDLDRPSDTTKAEIVHIYLN